MGETSAESRVVATGLGLTCALGAGCQIVWQRLLTQQSGIRVRQPFSELPAVPLGMIGSEPVQLPVLIQELVTATLEDAGLSALEPDCGVVIGSSRGFQAEWERLARDQQQTPGLTSTTELGKWLQLLPASISTRVAQQLQIRGPVLAPMAACSSGLWAIAQGYELIRSGICQQVLVGGVESPITPLTLVGFRQAGALATTGAYPFDRRRQGLVLGEGGGLILLENLRLAQQRSAHIYGEILGFGFAADAHHVTAPSASLESAAAALQQCLSATQNSTGPRPIDYVHAHGTATQLNDATEATLLQKFWPQGIPVSSTKGATGHTLGAAGALGAVFCLLSLQHQILPPTCGLQQPAFLLDLVRQPRCQPISTTLCFSFGFGGQNAVLSLGKAR